MPQSSPARISNDEAARRPSKLAPSIPIASLAELDAPPGQRWI
jgi:hypothetical protein